MMKITEKKITDFSMKSLKRIIEGDIEGFQTLKPGDMMSLYKFICMLACEQKSDIFVTLCPLLIVNRKNIEKNTGVEIKTPRETLQKVTRKDQ